MAKLLNEYQIGDYLYQIYDDRPAFDFLEVKQVHGKNIINTLDSKELEADGIITSSNIPLAIKTADCLPIAIIGENGIANLHAGWRGLAQEIIKEESIKALGPKIVFIGPHISEENYEVGEEFKQNFPGSNAFSVLEGSVHFSLEKELRSQIIVTYGNIEIISANICTFSNLNYNSYRRNQTTKRNYNILKRN